MKLGKEPHAAREPGFVTPALCYRPGMGNLFTGRMKCALSLGGRKINWFYLKILSLPNYEEEWLLLTYYLSTCLSWSFVLTRRCALTW